METFCEEPGDDETRYKGITQKPVAGFLVREDDGLDQVNGSKNEKNGWFQGN